MNKPLIRVLVAKDHAIVADGIVAILEAVKYHLKGIFAKLGVRKRGAVAREAMERGLLAV